MNTAQRRYLVKGRRRPRSRSLQGKRVGFGYETTLQAGGHTAISDLLAHF